MKVLIRAPQLTDIPAIVRLISELASTAGETSPITADYVARYLTAPSSRVLLAEVDEDVVGVLSYSIRPDLYHAGDCCLIEELIVNHKWRSRGVGRALMAELRLRLAGCKEVSVGVAAQNTAALKFYRRQGLVEEAVLLEKHL